LLTDSIGGLPASKTTTAAFDFANYDENLDLAALENPIFRELWIAALVSGTCVAAHDTAATWMLNMLSPSPFMISLLSTERYTSIRPNSVFYSRASGHARSPELR
jgi:hypothetical protein